MRRRGARSSWIAISIQHSGGGTTLCPLEARARIVGGSATPHLARSLGHKYANANARAVVRDLEENHGRKLAPSYVADIAQAIAEAAGQPVVEQNAHAPQSPPAEVASAVLGLDGTGALFCEEGFKQCMVGTIALYDAAGERLETISLGQARRWARRSSSGGSMANGSASANAIPKRVASL